MPTGFVNDPIGQRGQAIGLASDFVSTVDFCQPAGVRIVPCLVRSLLVCAFALVSSAPAAEAQNSPPAGFTALFNGGDLSGWHGLGTFDVRRYAAMSDD